MNLPGPQQQIANGRGQKGRESLANMVRSRPISAKPPPLQRMTVRMNGAVRRRFASHTSAGRVSVWDEVHAAANGALLRRIKILITDDTRFERDEAAWR
jgi:hypothetical protein